MESKNALSSKPQIGYNGELTILYGLYRKPPELGTPHKGKQLEELTRSFVWKIKGKNYPLKTSPRWMGILNVTPDSFSDGGELAVSADPRSPFRVDLDAAIRKALTLIGAGTDILDIGGESTRPGSSPVPAQEQILRTEPVIRQLASITETPISIDTTSAEVADRALAAGASIVNDISGALFDPEMAAVVRKNHAGICIGHIQGTPADMQHAPNYQNAASEVALFLRQRREELIASGIDPEQIVIDPGIGFGKSTTHNLEILSKLNLLQEIGAPILIGLSRKRFLDDLRASGSLPDPPETISNQRDFWTAVVIKRLFEEGISVFRVHDVGYLRKALADPKFPRLSLF